jgi:hypothetical protein
VFLQTHIKKIPVANTGSEPSSPEEDNEQNRVKNGAGNEGQADQNLQNDLDGFV